MLFNSYSFLFGFLPLTILGYCLVGRLQVRRLNLAWIIACSVLFYGFWNPLNLAIMLPSIAVNYGFALAIRHWARQEGRGERKAHALTVAGVTLNLCFLGYFKYKNFFIESVNDVTGTQWILTAVILPLGISFITFQKIAFLLDVRARVVEDFDLFDFLTFVFFFPQLIAGPIVHYREMMPQFAALKGGVARQDLAVGLCLFSMGLFKKVVLADGIAAYSTPLFESAARGETMTLFHGWMGALSYTFQIYFDFSGYSDMAIGLARVFGIVLPANFNSPLRASSIIEFWSRWHMTLTRFLTAYVYTPLVMGLTRSRMRRGRSLLSRKSAAPGAFVILVAWPTLVTMGLSGLWHGAGVTFLIWGALHGFYLIVNHAWRQWRPKGRAERYDRWMHPIGWTITFLCVVIAMVLFRAPTVGAAGTMLAGMFGLHGISLPRIILEQARGLGALPHLFDVAGDASSASRFAWNAVWLAALFAITTCVPNSLQVMRAFSPALSLPDESGQAKVAGQTPFASLRRRWLSARVNLDRRWALTFALFFLAGLLGIARPSEFLYWQF